MLEIRRIQKLLCEQFGWRTPRMFRLIGVIVRLGYYAGYKAAQHRVHWTAYALIAADIFVLGMCVGFWLAGI